MQSPLVVNHGLVQPSLPTTSGAPKQQESYSSSSSSLSVVAQLVRRNELGNLGLVVDCLPKLTVKELDEVRFSDTATEAINSCSTLPRTSGFLVAWGRSDEFQLASEAKDLETSPRRIVSIATPILMVSASAHHTLAVTASGALLGWGLNKFGRLGTGGCFLFM